MSAIVSTPELPRRGDSEESLLLDSGNRTKGCQRMETSMICALPDDLLLEILNHVPTKDAIATSILSERWRYVWTMLPSLELKDEGISESFGCFVDKSLQLHKSHVLDSLTIELGPHYPVDVDVGEWVEYAVNRGVEELDFKLLWTAEPTRFPKSLYTCETLVDLTLSNQILVDVSYPACLPSLEYLTLDYVVYKDEDSFDRLLSSCNILKWLTVNRHKSDNLKTFTVKVPSLEKLNYTSSVPKYVVYEDEVEDTEVEEEDEVEDSEVEDEDDEEDEDDLITSLVIDSPALEELNLWDFREDYCLIENMHCLDEAFISFDSKPDVKFLRSFSSVIYLQFFLCKSLAACCYNIKFSRLTKLRLIPDSLIDWCEPLKFCIQNSPKLKILKIDNICAGPSPSWNQPSSVPECLSNHLEVLKWKYYGGREGEKQILTFILANSKCLKTVKISLVATCNIEETQKELESIPRISTLSQLILRISLPE